jgi:hypothetical protein
MPAAGSPTGGPPSASSLSSAIVATNARRTPAPASVVGGRRTGLPPSRRRSSSLGSPSPSSASSPRSSSSPSSVRTSVSRVQRVRTAIRSSPVSRGATVASAPDSVTRSAGRGGRAPSSGKRTRRRRTRPTLAVT